MSLQKAIQEGRSGNFGAALGILSTLPPTASTLFVQGLCFLNQGDIVRAKQSFSSCLASDPGHVGANLNLANLLISEGHYRQAQTLLTRAESRARDTDLLGVTIGLAYVSMKIGDHLSARRYKQKALKLAPHIPEVLNVSGLVEEAFGSLTRAKENFLDALRHNPRLTAAKVNLARIYLRLGDSKVAKSILDEALYVGVPDLDTCLSAAKLYQSLGDANIALQLLRSAEQDNTSSWAVRLAYFSHFVEARDWDLASFHRQLLGQCQEFSTAGHEDLFLTYAVSTCDWREVPGTLMAVRQKLANGIQILNPLMLSYLSDNPRDVQVLAESSVSGFTKERADPASISSIAGPGITETRSLRIGYMSGDFRHHAIGQLTEELFSAHRANGTFVVGIYTGPLVDNDDRYFSSIKKSFDLWIDSIDFDQNTLLSLIRSQKLDLLIDLSGHTSHSRLDILSAHPALFTASYLGFPGTTGLSNVDLLFADSFVIQDSTRRYFSEAEIINLSPAYQVNSSLRPLPHRQSRTEQFLPEDCFVFCCFNGVQKITPDQFSCWVNILRAARDSVLWLLCPTAISKVNLRREFLASGLPESRLIFADYAPLPAHISRLAVGDLFLDTFPYTAHTTASDALWAGLPIITRIGESFHSRVCGSLLRSVGLEEFICESDKEYSEKAIFLYQNPGEISKAKEHLKVNRCNFKIFDSQHYADQIERELKSRLSKY